MWEQRWSRIPPPLPEDGRPYSRNSLAFMKSKVQHRAHQCKNEEHGRKISILRKVTSDCVANILLVFSLHQCTQIRFLGLIHFACLSHRDEHLLRIRGDAHCCRYKEQFSSFVETQLNVKVTSELNCDQFLVFGFLYVNSFSL